MLSFDFEIKALPPFRLDYTVWALRRRDHNLVDRWDGVCYRRALLINDVVVEISVSQPNVKDSTLLIEVSGASHSKELEYEISKIIRKTLGIERNCSGFYTTAKKNERLLILSKKFVGVRPPRFPSTFEALVNAIACQQLTLDFGITVLNRLSEAVGRSLPNSSDNLRSFPSPKDVSVLSVEDLRSMSFSRQKATAIINIAKSISEDNVDLDRLETLDNEKLSAELQDIKGIGRWSAEYVLLRGFGRIDIFPGDDVGAQKNLQLWFNLPTRPRYDEIKVLTREWSPYAGFIYFHLLLAGLAKKGYVSEIKEII